MKNYNLQLTEDNLVKMLLEDHRVFKYQDGNKTYDVTFDLKLVCNDRTNLSDENKYSKYWFDDNDFEWMKV